MGEVGSRAPAWMGEADPEEADLEEVTHPWVASVYPSQVQLDKLGRRSGLQGPWLELRDPRKSLQSKASESPSG